MHAPLRKISEVPASTKARILLAAEEVFADRGFEGASTREIAAKAGVNISSLHYHWGSKVRLYEAVLRNLYGQLIEISRDTSPVGPRSGSARNVPPASIDRIFDCFAANPNIPRLLLRRILEGGELGDAVEPDVFLCAWTRGFSGWMKQGVRRARAVDAPVAVLTLHSALLLFTLDSRHYARALGGRITDPAIARRIRSYLGGLCARLVSADPKATA
jgi:AcrR family transcriptional regulator